MSKDSPYPKKAKNLVSTQVLPRIIKYEKLCVILHYHHHLPIYVHSWKFSSIFFRKGIKCTLSGIVVYSFSQTNRTIGIPWKKAKNDDDIVFFFFSFQWSSILPNNHLCWQWWQVVHFHVHYTNYRPKRISLDELADALLQTLCLFRMYIEWASFQFFFLPENKASSLFRNKWPFLFSWQGDKRELKWKRLPVYF